MYNNIGFLCLFHDGGVSVVAIGIGMAVLLQGGGYRSIVVEQFGGTVNITGEKNNGQAGPNAGPPPFLYNQCSVCGARQ